MTAQQIHERLWGFIVRELYEAEPHDKLNVSDLKSDYLKKMYRNGLISDKAYVMLLQNNMCVLCALYSYCHECPLYEASGGKSCNDAGSLWHKLIAYDCRNAVEFAEAIRDLQVGDGTYSHGKAVLKEEPSHE